MKTVQAVDKISLCRVLEQTESEIKIKGLLINIMQSAWIVHEPKGKIFLQ